MGQISSINFKKSSSFQIFHNADERPSYAIGGQLECDRNGYEALKLKQAIITKAKQAYNQNKSPKAPPFKAKSYEWSAVVNLKPDSTMDDLKELARHFESKYGFQCYQIAIHRDEGHIDEQGQKQINHHAHLEFITLDKHTGKNNYRRELISPKILRQIQTEVAQILKMQRGQDRRKTGVKRVEPRIYAQQKEQEKAQTAKLKQELQKQILSKQEIKAQFEKYRKEHANKGLNADFFRELSANKKELLAKKETTQDELNQLFENLEQKRKGFLGVNKGSLINDLKKTIQDTTQELNDARNLANEALNNYNAALAKETKLLEQEKEQYQIKQEQLKRREQILEYERETEAKRNQKELERHKGYQKYLLEKEYQAKFEALSIQGVAAYFKNLWEKAKETIAEQAKRLGDEIKSLRKTVAQQQQEIDELYKNKTALEKSNFEYMQENLSLRGQICSLSDENKKLKDFIDQSKKTQQWSNLSVSEAKQDINSIMLKAYKEINKREAAEKSKSQSRNRGLSR